MNKALLVLLVLLAGCANPAGPEQSSVAAPTQGARAAGIHLAPPAPDYHASLTTEQIQDDLRDQVRLTVQMHRISATEPDWQAARRRLVALVDQPSALPRTMREQAVAGHLLQHHLLPGASAEKQPYIAEQVRLLVAHGNPEGDLIADAIEAAGSALSDAERRALAARAVPAARAAAERDAACGEACSVARLEQALRRDGIDVDLRALPQPLRAVVRLNDLAAS